MKPWYFFPPSLHKILLEKRSAWNLPDVVQRLDPLPGLQQLLLPSHSPFSLSTLTPSRGLRPPGLCKVCPLHLDALLCLLSLAESYELFELAPGSFWSPRAR